MVTSSNVLLICTATATALMAGLFFSWSYSVMPGLAQLPDREFIASMQAMNQAIQNSIFFSAFFGAAILLPISTYVQYSQASVNVLSVFITSYIGLLARYNVCYYRW